MCFGIEVWNSIGGMNTIRPKNVVVLMMVVESTLKHIAPKSHIGVPVNSCRL